VALYEPLGVQVVVTGPGADDAGVQDLRERLADRTSVLFGQSGSASPRWSTGWCRRRCAPSAT
jgi:hypothetical protein